MNLGKAEKIINRQFENLRKENSQSTNRSCCQDIQKPPDHSDKGKPEGGHFIFPSFTSLGFGGQTF